MTLVSIEVVFYSKKFETAKNLAVFKNVNFELAQALIKYGKSHRLKGGCYKWWGIVRYLRTNLDELMCLTEQIQNIKNKL